MRHIIRHFGFSALLSVIAVAYVARFVGPGATVVVLVLAVIELSFSFDNAVVNATVLRRLSSFWRQLFLTLGIVVAIFIVRAILPIAIVSITAGLPFRAVLELALHKPTLYSLKLTAAQPAINAFGGAFLLMLALHFFMAVRRVHWLRAIEQPLGKLLWWWLPLAVAALAVSLIAWWPANAHQLTTLAAGGIGIGSYLCMHGLIVAMDRSFAAHRKRELVGAAAFMTFLYLELLDASLSFDGVIGAFAITTSVVLIGIGLGIGAIWVRTLTVYMVERRLLDIYRYLEHGAHYAIFVLASAMLVSIVVPISDYITGVLCLGLIAAAAVTSRQAARHEPMEEPPVLEP